MVWHLQNPNCQHKQIGLAGTYVRSGGGGLVTGCCWVGRKSNRQLKINCNGSVLLVLKLGMWLSFFNCTTGWWSWASQTQANTVFIRSRGGGGVFEGEVGLRVNATVNKLTFNVSVPIILDLIVCSSRQSSCYQRPPADKLAVKGKDFCTQSAIKNYGFRKLCWTYPWFFKIVEVVESNRGRKEYNWEINSGRL